MRQHQEHFLAQRAGQMRRGVADGDDEVAGVDQRGQLVDVFGVVDGVEMDDRGAGGAGGRSALGSGVAVLQIDEAQPRLFQKRAQRVERKAFVAAELLVGAEPGQAADAFVRRCDGFAQRGAA